MKSTAKIRYEAYVKELAGLVGSRRQDQMRAYLEGLLLPGERKSIEPMAARIDPQNVRARHQAMHHFVANGDWDDAAFLKMARQKALSWVLYFGRLEAWIVDDTGFPKQGHHSVGVGHQYCGVLGKVANCQVAVTVALANQFASIPAAFRLYLPEDWAKDPDRREETGIPAEVVFKPKTAIALEMIGALRRARVPKAPILADAAYGDELVFRQELTTRGWWYVVAVRKDTGVWVARVRLDPNKKSMGSGRHAKEIVRRGQLQFMDAKTVAESLRDRAWHEITWRNGTKGLLRSRFAVLPARPGTWDSSTPQPKSFERLLIEWPKGEPEPTDYWLSTMPESKLLRDLVSLAKLRWRIEQDFLERVFPAGVREPIGLSPVGSWVTGVRPWGSKNLNLNRRIWIRCESA